MGPCWQLSLFLGGGVGGGSQGTNRHLETAQACLSLLPCPWRAPLCKFDSFLRVQENCKPAPVDAFFFFFNAGKFAAIIASGRRKAPNEKRGSTFFRDNSSEKLKHNLLPETFIRFLPGSFPQKL